MSSIPEEFEFSSAPKDAAKDLLDVSWTDPGRIQAELTRIFSTTHARETLDAAADKAVKLFESAEEDGYFGAAVAAVEAYCKSPDGLHQVVVFGMLCEAALTPSSNERKALNIQQIGFEPKDIAGAGKAQKNRLAASCILAGPLVQLCSNRPEIASRATDILLALTGEQDEISWRKIGHDAYPALVRGLHADRLPQETIDKLPFCFWTEVRRSFGASSFSREFFGEALRARAGEDAELQEQCVANAWLSLDEKEILAARSAFPSLGMQATLVAIEREAARSPHAYDNLCRRAGIEHLHVQNAVAACGGKRGFSGYSQRIAEFASPLPSDFYKKFFACFAEGFDAQLLAKQKKEIIRQERRRLEQEATRERIAAIASEGKASKGSAKAQSIIKPAAPATAEKSPNELRNIFLEANPDISQRLDAAKTLAQQQRSHLLYVAQLGPHDEPTRGYPLLRPFMDERPETSSKRKAKTGHAAIQAKLKKDLDRLGANFKVGATPKKSGHKRPEDRLARPLASLGNAFTLPASQLHEATGGAKEGKVVGRIQQDFEREDRNIQSLSEFTTACLAYAYATRHGHRNARPLRRTLPR